MKTSDVMTFLEVNVTMNPFNIALTLLSETTSNYGNNIESLTSMTFLS